MIRHPNDADRQAEIRDALLHPANRELSRTWTARSKAGRLVAAGWKLLPIPYFWPEGRLWHNSQTGQRNDALISFFSPAGWVAIPPESADMAARVFPNPSPINAIRWAFDCAGLQKGRGAG